MQGMLYAQTGVRAVLVYSPPEPATRTCDRPCTHYVPTTSGAWYYVKGILLPIHLENNFNGEYALNLKP